MSSYDFAMLQLQKTCRILAEGVIFLDQKQSRFTEITPKSLQKLTTILRLKLEEYAHSTRLLMEHAGRTQPSVMDVEHMFKMKKESLKDIILYAKVRAPKGVIQKLPLFPVPRENVIDDNPTCKEKSKEEHEEEQKEEFKPKLPAIQKPEPRIPIFTDLIDYENTDFGFSIDVYENSEESDSDSDNSDSVETAHFEALLKEEGKEAIQNFEVKSDSRPQYGTANSWSLERFLLEDNVMEGDFEDLEQFFPEMLITSETSTTGVEDLEMRLEKSEHQERTPEEVKGLDADFDEFQEDPYIPKAPGNVKNLTTKSPESQDPENPDDVTWDEDPADHLDFETLPEDYVHQDMTRATLQDVAKNLESTSEALSHTNTGTPLESTDHQNEMTIISESVTNPEMEEMTSPEKYVPETSNHKDSDAPLYGYAHFDNMILKSEHVNILELSPSENSSNEVYKNSDALLQGPPDATTTDSENVKHLNLMSSENSSYELQSHKESDALRRESPVVSIIISEDVENLKRNCEIWTSDVSKMSESKNERKSNKKPSKKRSIEVAENQEDIETEHLKKAKLRETSENSDAMRTETIPEDAEIENATTTTSEDVRDSKKGFKRFASSEISANQKKREKFLNSEDPKVDDVKEESQSESHASKSSAKKAKKNKKRREKSGEDVKILEPHSEVLNHKISETHLEDTGLQNVTTTTSEEVMILKMISENMTSCEVLTSEVVCHEALKAIQEDSEHRAVTMMTSENVKNLEMSPTEDKKPKKSERKSSGQESQHQKESASKDMKSLDPKSEIPDLEALNLEEQLNESGKSRKSKKKHSRKRKMEVSVEFDDQEEVRIPKKARLQETSENSEDVKNLESTSSGVPQPPNDPGHNDFIAMTSEEMNILEMISENMTSSEIYTSDVLCHEDSGHHVTMMDSEVGKNLKQQMLPRETRESRKSKKPRKASSRKREKKDHVDREESETKNFTETTIQEASEKSDPTPSETPRPRLTLKISRSFIAKATQVTNENQDPQYSESLEDVSGIVDTGNQRNSNASTDDFEYQKTSEDVENFPTDESQHKKIRFKNLIYSEPATSGAPSQKDSETLPEESGHRNGMPMTSKDVEDFESRRRKNNKTDKSSAPSTSGTPRQDSGYENMKTMILEDVKDSGKHHEKLTFSEAYDQKKRGKSLNSEDPKKDDGEIETEETKSIAQKPKKIKKKRGRCPFLM